ncbi:MAG: aldose 1-epimerase family protein [Daejeonella sp.]
MVTLENDLLKVCIREKGAELTSVINKLNGTEYLWQADAQVWPWHAPNLFPVVGACLNKQVLLDGVFYPMERHGFARNKDFYVLETTKTHAKFSLPYNTETFKVYPYKFTFQVLYDLFDTGLRVSFKVINQDNKAIYFSMGAHPAFNVPLNQGEGFEDYYLEFEQEEPLEKHLLSAEGFFTGKTEPVPVKERKVYLTRELFEKDALVFKNIRSKKVFLKHVKNNYSVSVSYTNFNYLGIWTKPDANFVCIEPWLGCADTEGNAVDLKHKEAIQQVEHGHVFEADFTIGIH